LSAQQKKVRQKFYFRKSIQCHHSKRREGQEGDDWHNPGGADHFRNNSTAAAASFYAKKIVIEIWAIYGNNSATMAWNLFIREEYFNNV